MWGKTVSRTVEPHSFTLHHRLEVRKDVEKVRAVTIICD
jgi:hypothetical protein